jgi:hypothetical protein
MPVHDWTRVKAGTFHDFHNAWNVEIRNALNGGILPPTYYAQTEQVAGDMGPDVLTLQDLGPDGHGGGPEAEGIVGAMAVMTAPPRVRITARAEADRYAARQKRVAVRHSSDDRVVALIEIISPGNKGARHAFRSFLKKAASALERGLQLLIIDLFPPSPRDLQGIHGALWVQFSDDRYQAPPDKPLTLAAYASDGPVKMAYVEPIAVGDPLPEMPLFLDPWSYVSAPLEATYQAAWRGVPRRWRDVIDPPPVEDRG